MGQKQSDGSKQYAYGIKGYDHKISWNSNDIAPSSKFPPKPSDN